MWDLQVVDLKDITIEKNLFRNFVGIIDDNGIGYTLFGKNSESPTMKHDGLFSYLIARGLKSQSYIKFDIGNRYFNLDAQDFSYRNIRCFELISKTGVITQDQTRALFNLLFSVSNDVEKLLIESTTSLGWSFHGVNKKQTANNLAVFDYVLGRSRFDSSYALSLVKEKFISEFK